LWAQCSLSQPSSTHRLLNAVCPCDQPRSTPRRFPINAPKTYPGSPPCPILTQTSTLVPIPTQTRIHFFLFLIGRPLRFVCLIVRLNPPLTRDVDYCVRVVFTSMPQMQPPLVWLSLQRQTTRSTNMHIRRISSTCGQLRSRLMIVQEDDVWKNVAGCRMWPVAKSRGQR
jgi:hypothetical protein